MTKNYKKSRFTKKWNFVWHFFRLKITLGHLSDLKKPKTANFCDFCAIWAIFEIFEHVNSPHSHSNLDNLHFSWIFYFATIRKPVKSWTFWRLHFWKWLLSLFVWSQSTDKVGYVSDRASRRTHFHTSRNRVWASRLAHPMLEIGTKIVCELC